MGSELTVAKPGTIAPREVSQDFGEGEDLFSPANQGHRSWWDRMTEEEKDWLEWVATKTEEARKLPSWKATARNFKKNFPNSYIPSQKTLARHLRRYLRATGRGEWLSDDNDD